MGATERQTYGARLCAEELLTNLQRHDKSAPSSTLTLEIRAGGLKMILENDGAPFDPTREPTRLALGSLEEAQPGGWGLALIHSFAEEFTYHRSDSGNVVQLSFCRHSYD